MNTTAPHKEVEVAVGPPTSSPATGPSASNPGNRRRRIAGALSFRNISAVYVFIALFVLYSLWIPETFLTATVWRTMLDAQAIPAIVAIGLILPLAAGVFDLAVGVQVGLAGVMTAWLLTTAGWPVWPSVVGALVVGGLVGLFSGILVVKARIDSFIATLGMSSVLAAVILWISDGQQVIGLPPALSDLALTEVAGITLPVYIMALVGLAVWYVLECTPVGRRVYATGGNSDAARLAGIRTSAFVVGTLVTSGVVAALAGVLLCARISTGDPTVGPGFLLPAFSAAFLGSTQFKGGRFNVLGTLAAVYVLAVGIKGLQLAGAPVFIPELFNGAALLIAVGLARHERTKRRGKGVPRSLRFGRGNQAPRSADSEVPAPPSATAE